MLEGTDGRKMSTSWGNIITVVDEPNDMFGKIMSLKDELIVKYFLLTTNISIPEINEIRKRLDDGENPMISKKKLACEIVSLYHSETEAKKAQENWEKTFSNKEIPEDVLEIKSNNQELFVDVLLKNKIISSKTEFRRLVDEGAITKLETKEKIKDYTIKVSEGTYRVGKKRFIKIKI